MLREAQFANPVGLHGYRYSAYTRIARLVLMSKTVAFEAIEVDPFAALPHAYAMLHPFGRVPVLTHGSLTLFETGAITRYVDRAFEGRALQPRRAAALARMDQVISVVDAYAYWPMVRQVASHGFFRPMRGEPFDPEEIEAGLASSRKVLAFLDDVAGEGEILTGHQITLADCHLAPMIDYFVRAAEGEAALAGHPALRRWWGLVSALDILKATDPFLVQPAAR